MMSRWKILSLNPRVYLQMDTGLGVPLCVLLPEGTELDGQQCCCYYRWDLGGPLCSFEAVMTLTATKKMKRRTSQYLVC